MEIAVKYRMLLLFIVALVATICVYGPILKIAKAKNIVDNPEARKLQKEPVPVMGGIAVFFGVVVGLCFYKTMISYTPLFSVLGAMIIMLYLGFIDDVISLKPHIRIIVEIIASLLLIYGLKARICCFQGLFGVFILPSGLSIALSVLTFVGIVNAINLIDGVDGLSSAFCIMILGFLGIACFLAHQFSCAALSAVSIGSLLPFFFHNVFGKESKMFIGDGGTLMMGTAISAMIMVLLSKNITFVEFPSFDFSRIAFVIAVLSVPVADTLRVMAVRIAQHRSPFSADKNHLHHLLLRVGCKHLQTTMIELFLNLFVIAVFFLSWWLGASIGVQLFLVIFTAALLNWGLAPILRWYASLRKE